MTLDYNKLNTTRQSDFTPFHPQLNPTKILAIDFQSKHTMPPLIAITTGSTAPISLPADRSYQDARNWETAHNKEITQLNKQNGITWKTRTKFPQHKTDTPQIDVQI